jgi:hypothetical protein
MAVPCDVAGCPNPARWYYPKPTLFGWNLCDTCKDTDPRGVDCLPLQEERTMRQDPDDECLCIRLQPIEDGKWMWNVGYPHGLTYEHGESDSPGNAVAVAKVALRLLSTKR